MAKPLRAMGVVLAFALAAAACGGDDDAAPEGDSPTPAATSAAEQSSAPADTAGATSAAPAESAPPAGADASFARVTIGDQAWSFAPTDSIVERCDSNFFGGFWVVFSGLLITLPGEDWAAQGVDQPATVEVSVGDQEWIARPDTPLPGVEPGQSQVDSWSIDGTRAEGTATFVDANALFAAAGGTAEAPEPVTGSFEAVCVAE